MSSLAKLGLDLWSMLLYFINMGLIFALVYFLLYPKIVGYLDKRKKQIADSINEANELKKLFQEKLDEINKEKEKTQHEMKLELDNARSFVDKRRAELTKEMEEEKARMFKEVQQEIDARKNQLVKEVEQKLMDTMRKIVVQVIQNKVPEDVIKQSVEESWSKYSKV